MRKLARSKELYQSRIEQAATYISQNLGEPLDLKQVAQASHFSPFHFHRIFTAALGETPQDFINRLRLERAANQLLKSPALTITQIALACGFSSSSTFARSFKKHFGMTASEFARTRLDDRGLAARRVSPPSEASIPEPALDVQVRLMPGLHVAYMASMKGYSLAEICRAWDKLCRWAAARDLFTPDTKVIGISFDDPLVTPKDKCRYYACITVPPDLPGDPRVGLLDIPPNRCAVYRVVCSAEQIELAYRAMYRDWFPASDWQPADYPGYEVYYQTPQTNAEGKYVMDICIPVVLL